MSLNQFYISRINFDSSKSGTKHTLNHFRFSICLGYRGIQKKRPISMFCWKLLRLLFFLLWCCQQRGTTLCKTIYFFVIFYFLHIQFIINIFSIILVLKYTINVSQYVCVHACVFQCKHQLAARLAASLGSYVEVKVSDEELALLLSKI
jgi:hypothetical protein